MDDAVKVHPQHEYCSSSYFLRLFSFVIGVLFVGMSAPLFEGFGLWFHYDTVCADFSNVISCAFGRGWLFL